jgi:transposase
MKNAKDKKIFRMQMIQYAIDHGNKPAARHFNTTVKTIRKWRKRYTDEKYQGLEDRSHAPHNPVQYTSDLEKRFVCWVKENHTGFGASFVKEKYNLDMSELAIRKAWRGEKLLKKRKRKHETKQDLREMKKKWKLFEQFDVDVKYLTDIPKLFIPIQQGLVPKYQYTFRDVVSGLMYIAYSETYGMMESCLFIETILEHLKSCGIDLSKSRCQTDNGSEFIGAWNKKGDSEFTKTLERYKVEHRTIPPGAHSWQSDVETVHYTIEIHFYDNESYQHKNDFLRKASSYVLYYNSRHKNKSKDKKTPWDIIQERDKTIPKKILNFMPFRIDYYFEQIPIASGGYHLIKSP